MVHLNDSKSELGSRIDRHEHVGAGQIGEAGLAHLLRHPRLAQRDLLPRDAGHGRGLRRDQPRAGVALAAGRAARAAAARGARRSAAAAPTATAPAEPTTPTPGDAVDRDPCRTTPSAAPRPRPSTARSSRWASPPLVGSSLAASCASSTCRPAAPGTPTRATTCSSCATSSRDGVIPLLGPPTSIGDFHHGALYYFLLAPAAALSGGDSPLAVIARDRAGGIAAVGVTWWLARSIGGPVAGLVAGLLMAVSATAVEESTFIWNPNLIALSSAIALAAAWRAWTTRRAALVARGGGRRGRDDALPRPRRALLPDRRRRCSSRTSGDAARAGPAGASRGLGRAGWLAIVALELPAAGRSTS